MQFMADTLDSYSAALKSITEQREKDLQISGYQLDAMDELEATSDTYSVSTEVDPVTGQVSTGAAASPVDSMLQNAVANFVTASGGATAQLSSVITGLDAKLQQDAATIATTALEGGAEVASQFGVGFADASPAMQDEITAQLGGIKSLVGGSLPEEGPLGGVPGSNPAYFGGQSVMQEFAAGFVSAEEQAGLVMADSISRLVDTIFTSYEKAMTDGFKNSSAISQMADQVIAQFGGKAEMGTLEGGADLRMKSGKELFKVALDKPGLVSVVTAIIMSGQETQKVLIAIKKDTEKLVSAPIMSQNLKIQGGTMTTAG